MGKATVTGVTFNISKTFKNGKTFDGDEISFTTDNGSKKKEFIFAKAPYRSEVQKCSVGDVIEAGYKKNGDFWNLDTFKFIEKGNGSAPASAPSSSGGGFKKDAWVEPPEKQASIQRQNALTNATSLITACLEQGVYKKTTSADIIIGEVLRVATMFTAFNSGTLQSKAIETDFSKVVVEKDDSPFDMDDDIDI